MLVDPAKGKAHVEGPEQRLGRKDLFDLMQQKALLQAQQGRGTNQVGKGSNTMDSFHICSLFEAT